MNAINTDTTVCPNCGHMVSAEVPVYHLRPGVILNSRYTIGLAVGEGGFGITYLGKDNLLDVTVAVKEFYPCSIVTRVNQVSMNVLVINESTNKKLYNIEKSNFISEARTLAKFAELPGTVNVIDFFEENNTAYIVMEYVKGTSLTEFLKRCGTISFEQTIDLLLPIMKSLKEVHKEGIVHGDISPDNIVIISNGQTKLLDFGAAINYMNNSKTQTSLKIKEGYSPAEQYRIKGQIGPWTDVYALCATIYRCITGTKPENACDRLAEDNLISPSEFNIYIESDIEAVLMKGLSVKHEDRFQNIESFLLAMKINTRNFIGANEINSASPNYNNTQQAQNYSEDVTRPLYQLELQPEEPKAELDRTVISPAHYLIEGTDFTTEKPQKKNDKISKALIAVFCVVVLLIGGVSALFVSKDYFNKHNVETILVDDSSQKVYVSEATLPDTVIKGNPFKIRGIVSANDGTIVNVYGCIETLDGKVLQESNHKVDSKTHNLKKSINNYLIFGNLGTGEYIYRVTVTTEKKNTKAVKTIIQCKFEVVKE